MLLMLRRVIKSTIVLMFCTLAALAVNLSIQAE
jgi:hypothetical protein